MLLCASLVRGQEEATESVSMYPRIVDKASEDPVPAPLQPKPRLEVSEDDVIRSRETPLGERMVRFQKLRPMSLPPIPERVRTKLDPEQAAAFQEAAREAMKHRRFIFVGATVYVPDGNPDQAKSFVRFWPQPGGEAVSMWVNANLQWLGGFADFRTEDTVYSLMMACSVMDIERREEMSRLAKFEWRAPDIPEFPEGEASFVVVESRSEPGDMKPFESLLELYRKDKLRLMHAFERRRAEAEKRRLERLADPPELKNLNIRYWRLD